MTETPETPGAPEAPTGPPGGAQPPAAPPPAAPPTAVGPAADYPVHLDVERQEEYSRFMPLIKWLLAIPHYIALIVLGIGAVIVAFISFFAVLFTGRYPEGCSTTWSASTAGGSGSARTCCSWSTRIRRSRSTTTRTTRRSFDIEYPEHVERWRPLLTWLLVIPYAIVAYFVILLAEIMSFFAFFTILFTRQVPGGLVQHRPDRVAVAGEKQRLHLLAGHQVPAVRLGLSG